MYMISKRSMMQHIAPKNDKNKIVVLTLLTPSDMLEHIQGITFTV
jgi:hypothetical protein